MDVSLAAMYRVGQLHAKASLLSTRLRSVNSSVTPQAGRYDMIRGGEHRGIFVGRINCLEDNDDRRKFDQQQFR